MKQSTKNNLEDWGFGLPMFVAAAMLTVLFILVTPLISDAAVCYGEYANPSTNAGETMNDAVSQTNGIYARPFTPTVNCTVTSVVLRMKATGNPTDGVTVQIWSDSGGTKPGSSLGSATQATGAITSSYSTTTTSITAGTLTSGTQYWVTYNRVGAMDNSNYIDIGGTFGSGSDLVSSNGGSTWSANNSQSVLEIDGTAPSVYVPTTQICVSVFCFYQ